MLTDQRPTINSNVQLLNWFRLVSVPLSQRKYISVLYVFFESHATDFFILYFLKEKIILICKINSIVTIDKLAREAFWNTV